MKKMLFAGAALLLATAANAATSYDLTAIGGAWTWGNTQWNNLDGQGYVDNAADIGTVDGLLHGPYVYSAPATVPGNGIYYYDNAPGTLTFSVNGGIVTTLNSLTILSSRSYSDDTLILLDVSNDAGLSWSNVLTSTTSALGWTDVGTGGTGTEIINLSFGGVSGNAFRFSASGAQVSLHSLTVNGGGTVPEPASWAMLIAGFGLVGVTMRRRSLATA